MRAYVSVFVRTAEDSHHKKVTRETFVSFLGALQGVASISHILDQDILANRTLIVSKDTSSDYGIDDAEVNRAHLEYQVEMNNFKDKLTTARPEVRTVIFSCDIPLIIWMPIDHAKILDCTCNF